MGNDGKDKDKGSEWGCGIGRDVCSGDAVIEKEEEKEEEERNPCEERTLCSCSFALDAVEMAVEPLLVMSRGFAASGSTNGWRGGNIYGSTGDVGFCSALLSLYG